MFAAARMAGTSVVATARVPFVVACLSFAGCGGGGSGSSTGTDSGADSAYGGGCAPIPSADSGSSESPAAGTISGSGLDAVLCPGGTFALVQGNVIATAPFLFTLSSQTVRIGSPSNATNGSLTVYVGLGSAGPDDFSSPCRSRVRMADFHLLLACSGVSRLQWGRPKGLPARLQQRLLALRLRAVHTYHAIGVL
jgi:hypothetical protein